MTNIRSEIPVAGGQPEIELSNLIPNEDRGGREEGRRLGKNAISANDMASTTSWPKWVCISTTFAQMVI